MYIYGRFPGNFDLLTVPQGKIQSFLMTEDIISPLEIYEKFNTQDCRGLVSVQLFAALNIFLSVDLKISKNTMTKFFSNLLMQTSSESNNSILLTFDATEKVATNLHILFRSKIDYFNKK